MKLKTHQATAKRFKQTATGKIQKRTCGQGHFNTRETGKVGRNKKSDIINLNSPKLSRTVKTKLVK